MERDNACVYCIARKSTGNLDYRSDRTLVLGGPATPISSSIATSLASSVLFPFAPSPFGLDLFALIAAAAPIPFASAIAAATIVSLFISLAFAIAAPILAAALAALAPIASAAPPAFALAIASVFAGRPLAEGVPVGLS
ncbi:hypothetical protein B2J93_8389 [Marssonina coronariae]|uniref:Uncharacterized protein n=1 Tax=Diplocarpon coronariae TaxID=2795749 RepID=A0A218ZB65_9HELO|nr:hypothetical protein B2J93_8389 [Marssonina coronariae]